MASTDDAVAGNDNQMPQNGASSSSLGLSRRDTTVTLALGGVIFVLLIVHWIRLGYSSDTSVTIERSDEYHFQVNLNESGWVEWAQLERIGDTLAQRIVADRSENGPFASIDDLQRVKGIGPKTVESIRPWIVCPECTPEEQP